MATARKTYRESDDRAALITRMKRIEGQARGIARMIEDDRYCVDILQQLSALRAAADEVAMQLLEHHIHGCVADAVREERGDEAIDELMEVIRKGVRR